MGQTKYKDGFAVRFHADELDKPLRWRKPRRIFVNSMSDLFHEDVTDEQIDRVWAAMLLAPHHTFQVLTKRTTRMVYWLSARNLYDRILRWADVMRADDPKLCQVGISDPRTMPAKWIWLGVSVESQAHTPRIDGLLTCPASVRFVSFEPLLSDVQTDLTGIDWAICGCESGPHARPMQLDWARSLRDQCVTAGVPFFLKQAKVDGKFTKMPALDGKVWDEMPTIGGR
jgi:protein gp37